VTDPFAAIQQAADQKMGGTVPCPQCGQQVPQGTLRYNSAGNMVCASCAASEQIAIGEGQAGKSILGAAVGAFVLSVFGLLCINPLALVSIGALSTGIFALSTLLRHPEYKRVMGDATWGLALVLAILGSLIALGTILLHGLAMFACAVGPGSNPW